MVSICEKPTFPPEDAMAVYKILHYPHILLRKPSTAVEKFTPSLKTFTQNMIETMNAFEGIGLAAPQVGILKRVMIVDVRPYLENPQLKEWHGSISFSLDGEKKPLPSPMILVNPEIVRKDTEISFPFDGCLSFPGVDRGQTTRWKDIVLEAKDTDGKAVRIECNGILSICLQHEMDHLEGVLFIDRVQGKVSENEVAADIMDHEEDAATRRKMKKLKLVDARSEKLDFL
ncbi:MAG: peptide deformylase [Proteobacteria bacterium]|nr:peptide deformylase [Pseudomonadota bacterium]